MIGHSNKNKSLIASISRKLKALRKKSISEIKDTLVANKTLDKVGNRLDQWIKDGRHHESFDSMDEILEDLGLTGEELSFYCSSVLKKKFLTWRKEMRIDEAKTLLLEHPDTPACHIGYAVGLSDKSNFRQQFKSVVGCTPTEWRERQLNDYSVKGTID